MEAWGNLPKGELIDPNGRFSHLAHSNGNIIRVDQ
jgi:hypothetical protein